MTGLENTDRDETICELLQTIERQNLTIERLLEEVRRLRQERAAWDRDQYSALIAFRDLALGIRSSHGG